MNSSQGYLIIPISPEELKLIIAESVKSALEMLKKDEERQKMITLQEAAEKLNVSKVTLHTWAKQGLITKLRVPGSKVVRVKLEDVTKVFKIDRPYSKIKDRI